MNLNKILCFLGLHEQYLNIEDHYFERKIRWKCIHCNKEDILMEKDND